MKLLIHFQTSIAILLKFGNGEVISSHIYNGCNYLSMLRLKWNKSMLIKGAPGIPSTAKCCFMYSVASIVMEYVILQDIFLPGPPVDPGSPLKPGVPGVPGLPLKPGLPGRPVAPGEPGKPETQINCCNVPYKIRTRCHYALFNYNAFC